MPNVMLTQTGNTWTGTFNGRTYTYSNVPTNVSVWCYDTTPVSAPVETGYELLSVFEDVRFKDQNGSDVTQLGQTVTLNIVLNQQLDYAFINSRKKKCLMLADFSKTGSSWHKHNTHSIKTVRNHDLDRDEFECTFSVWPADPNQGGASVG